MSAKRLPLGIKLIAVLHLLTALFYLASLFATLPGAFDDDMERGIWIGTKIITALLALAHVSVGVGLFKGKRLALLGAIVLGSLSAFPAFMILVISIPAGIWSDVAPMFLPLLLFNGAIVLYLSLSRTVRQTFA